MTDFAKLDVALAMALRTYGGEMHPDDEPVSEGISVTIVYNGDLATIEAEGFILHLDRARRASGVVLFKDLGSLSELDQIEWISAGQVRTVDLDKSVTDISVRATTAALGDGLWHAVVATGAFTGGADATGAGVIVAVIDTGIDYTHPMFMKQIAPTKKTRILRIWDQGLLPAAAADCPGAALLESTERYGVEFDQAEIDAALAGGPALAHKDCIGHGTHVAGIAAGGNKFAVSADASVMGVAPEADIIAVKMLDTPNTINYFTGPAGVNVGFDMRFRDAVLYCLRTAKALGKPVVINMSFGNTSEAGDGLDEEAIWIDERMDPAHAADNLHFPNGAVIVKSSGNDGDAARRRVARIVVPAGGEVTVPIMLEDKRGALQTSFINCANIVFKPSMSFSLWYRRANPFSAVSFALRLPHRAVFTGDMSVGGNMDESYGIRVGPPAQLINIAPGPNAHRLFALHGGEPSVNHPDGGSVRRHSFSVSLQPRTSGGTVTYLEGTYEVRIKAPVDTELFLMCRGQGWAAGKFVTFRVADTMADGSALNAAIDVTSEFSSVDTLGRNAITVAAYDDKDGNAADAAYRHIAKFSSRGPLRDFSDPPGLLALIATKPDIAAPGVKINSAKSRESDPGVIHTPDWLDGNRFEDLQGTSMAAPIITGVIALMLDKKPDLTTSQVRTHLAGAVRAPVNPSAAPAGTRAYGAGLVNGRGAHNNVP